MRTETVYPERTRKPSGITPEMVAAKDAYLGQFVTSKRSTVARQKLKDTNAAVFRASHMSQRPPAEKQLDYLRALGIDTVPGNRAEASWMIDERRGGRL